MPPRNDTSDQIAADFQKSLQKSLDNSDHAAAKSLVQEYFTLDKSSAFDFTPTLKGATADEIKKAQAKSAEYERTAGLTGVLFRTASYWDNQFRNQKFFRPARGKLRVTVVAQGDSWFSFPFFEPTDLSENLAQFMSVFTMGCPGDDVSDMANGEKLDELIWNLDQTKAEVLALSGGGNELIGEDFAAVLNMNDAGRSGSDFLNTAALEHKIKTVIQSFRMIIDSALTANPQLLIVLHSYDKPIPRPKNARLGPILHSKSIPQSKWHEVCGAIIDRFDAALLELESEFKGSIYRIDLRGIANGDVKNWSDEIHLDSKTFKRAAEKFASEIFKQLRK